MDMLRVSSVEETKRIEKMGDLLWSLSTSRPKPTYKVSWRGNQMGSDVVWMIHADSHDSRQVLTLWHGF